MVISSCAWRSLSLHVFLVSMAHLYATEDFRAVFKKPGDERRLIAAENDFIKNTVTGTFWIGLEDQTTPGEFTWVDGSPLTFQDFAIGEPTNGASEACVEIQDDGWRDAICSNTQAWICETTLP